MIGNPLRPKWRLLDLIVLFAIGLLMVDAKAHLSTLGHQFAEVAIVLVWLVLMAAWLRANASAITRDEWQKTGRMNRIVPGRISVYRSHVPAGSQTSAGQHDGAIQMPQSSSEATRVDLLAGQRDAQRTEQAETLEKLV